MSVARSGVADAELRFEDVYDAHFDYLWRSARAFGVPERAVDDVLQDLFVVVHRRLSEFEGRSSLRTWLTRILVRVVQEHRRRFRRREAWLTPLDDEQGHGSADTPHDSLARRQAARILEQILDGLDPDQRTVFVLAEMEELPASEIATIVDASVNTVHSRLRLARRHYERRLAQVRARDEWRLP